MGNESDARTSELDADDESLSRCLVRSHWSHEKREHRGGGPQARIEMVRDRSIREIVLMDLDLLPIVHRPQTVERRII
jgi:hypothetical protein